jgi:hypothetical protein
MLRADSTTGTDNTVGDQGPMAVLEYIRELKEAMGEEWVRANPQAFALLVQAAAISMHGRTIGDEISKLTGAVVTLSSRV